MAFIMIRIGEPKLFKGANFDNYREKDLKI